MIKFLFFDYRDYELVEGFERQLESPQKYQDNPLLEADRPWEHGNITLYGSVLKVSDRPFQLWYSVIEPPWHMMLAYAESDDGLDWRKPDLDVYLHEGSRTNIVFAGHPHGATVIYDEADPRPDSRYKMLCGAAPTGHVCAYHSEDGIHWLPVQPEPVIGNDPDCPMSLLRRPEGTYVAHHRVPRGGRRIGRSESDDFTNWHGGRIVLEPGPDDPAQLQMYGMGATMYGDYEIGTLWAYHTDLEDRGPGKMCGYQEAELTYARSGVAWHRARPGQAFIPHGGEGAWDCGNLQCASAPVFLENEIRYYFAASNVRHSVHWELEPGRFGIGMAALKPDRFVALVVDDEPATIYTRRFTSHATEARVNAHVADGGEVRLALLDGDCNPLPGFEMSNCVPITGDSLGHRVRWQGEPQLSEIGDRPIRWQLQATRAHVYSVWLPEPDEDSGYCRFRSI